MSIRPDSYGNVAAVAALTRHLLDGAPMFNEATRPSLVEVEGMVDRWSAMLNMALRARGVPIPLTYDVAVLAAGQWVIRQVAAEVELTQRGVGYSDEEGSRTAGLRMSDVDEIATQLMAAVQPDYDPPAPALGYYTGLAPRVTRWRDNTFERPFFWRGQFDPQN